jgi:hypothetical protein
MVNGCEAVAAKAAGKLVDRLISWPVGKGDKLEARRLRGSVDQRATHLAKVQIGAKLLSKSAKVKETPLKGRPGTG